VGVITRTPGHLSLCLLLLFFFYLLFSFSPFFPLSPFRRQDRRGRGPSWVSESRKGLDWIRDKIPPKPRPVVLSFLPLFFFSSAEQGCPRARQIQLDGPFRFFLLLPPSPVFPAPPSFPLFLLSLFSSFSRLEYNNGSGADERRQNPTKLIRTNIVELRGAVPFGFLFSAPSLPSLPPFFLFFPPPRCGTRFVEGRVRQLPSRWSRSSFMALLPPPFFFFFFSFPWQDPTRHQAPKACGEESLPWRAKGFPSLCPPPLSLFPFFLPPARHFPQLRGLLEMAKDINAQSEGIKAAYPLFFSPSFFPPFLQGDSNARQQADLTRWKRRAGLASFPPFPSKSSVEEE